MVRISRIERAQRNAQLLSVEFDEALDTFVAARPFTGPSLYFHQRAVATVGARDSVVHALQDDVGIEYIYATLTSWGMHRLGSRGSELVSFDVFAESLRSAAAHIDSLRGVSLVDLTCNEAEDVGAEIWALIERLDVSATSSRLVAGSKALHHLLPELLPPIDRRYTGAFFFGSSGKTWSMGEGRAFTEMFPLLREIASESSDAILRAVNASREDPWSYMATSSTKVLDNALVGFVLRHSL